MMHRPQREEGGLDYGILLGQSQVENSLDYIGMCTNIQTHHIYSPRLNAKCDWTLLFLGDSTVLDIRVR